VLGGLARRVSFVEKLKDEGTPVIVIDSGHLFTDVRSNVDKKQALTKARLISSAYKRMHVAAVNVSDSDLMQGLAFLRNEASRGLPLISANLVDPAGKSLVFPPYVIKKIDKISIAFLGLLSPYATPAIQNAVGKKLQVKDPVETAREMVKKLLKRADIIILLSDLDAKTERDVIKAAPGIHFVLGGREGRFIQAPLWEGQTPILESYRNGMYIGKLHLFFVKAASHFKNEGKCDNCFLWRLIPLDASMKEDREITTWIRKAGIGKD
jgi:2',3'-cyclic-nucleotide 2'-phosphodiesterase (5'-nucleotidase family)